MMVLCSECGMEIDIEKDFEVTINALGKITNFHNVCYGDYKDKVFHNVCFDNINRSKSYEEHLKFLAKLEEENKRKQKKDKKK